jgi:hypothetical protein
MALFSLPSSEVLDGLNLPWIGTKYYWSVAHHGATSIICNVLQLNTKTNGDEEKERRDGNN